MNLVARDYKGPSRRTGTWPGTLGRDHGNVRADQAWTGRLLPAVAFGWNKSASQSLRVDETTDARETSNPATLHGMAVRRLTPRECERLQGFPDDYTAITYRRKPAADGPRYRALGNSMAVPVMRWIGERIALADRCTGEGA